MNTVDPSLLSESDDFINQVLPSLYFSVVEHGSVLKLNCVAVGAVAYMPSTILIQVLQQQVFELTMVPS